MASSHSKSVSLLPPELTPKIIYLIATHCGDRIAFGIWRNYGGGHIHVPFHVTISHHLAGNLGLDDANVFCDQFGGDFFSIPRGKKLLDAVRNTVIRQQRQQGWTLFDLAREYHFTERHILNICNGKDVMDTLQLDMFSQHLIS
ncbi:MAG: hypothetical protein LUQ18_00030 [Methylococcaceae bacterium]|nr:hypothetical protein [Methylococcaceae bacterium]